MKTLRSLHRGLARVRRYRTLARVGTAFAWFLTIVLWVLLAAFLLDVTMHMGILERVIVLFAFVGVTAWALVRYLVPALQTREDEIDLALMVERQQGIGSDLVASLQFSDPRRQQFGSPQLREAVVDYTDEVSGQLDYLEGFSRKDLWQRLGLFAVTLLVVLIPILAFPAHVEVFFSRMALSNAHYPTRVNIDQIVSPGETAVYGQPITFRVQASGEFEDLPEDGRVEVRAKTSELKTTVELIPVDESRTVYEGELARALDDLSYRVYLGDAYTDPLSVELIPLPIVEVDLDIETPEYAREKFDTGSESGRHAVALEGSKVVPRVKADKDLNWAAITINEQRYPLTNRGDYFTLASEETPLAGVEATLRYEIEVEDTDGLHLERPVSGTLHVRSDQPPRIAAATVTEYVLPVAAPRIKYKALDDYGLSRVQANIEVLRLDATAMSAETEVLIVQPEGHPETIEDTARIELEPLGLEKGDRVLVTLSAVDYRGDKPGEAGERERIVFEVTDRSGFQAAMRQLDTQMDKKLDQIIKAQLGMGD